MTTTFPSVLARGVRFLGAFLVVALLGCAESDQAWYLDPEYSKSLLLGWQYYQLKTKSDNAQTVDIVQIFRTDLRHSRLRSLREIRSSPFVFESYDRDFIARFFQAARRRTECPACNPLMSAEVLHLVAFDRDLMRVAYFKYYDCTNPDVGAISEYGSGSTLFSSDLATLLKPLRTRC